MNADGPTGRIAPAITGGLTMGVPAMDVLTMAAPIMAVLIMDVLATTGPAGRTVR